MYSLGLFSKHSSADGGGTGGSGTGEEEALDRSGGSGGVAAAEEDDKKPGVSCEISGEEACILWVCFQSIHLRMVVEREGAERGRKRLLIDPEDRVALQRQKRMIKNRESAARSRERKHAYTVELETLVMPLVKILI
ncbi:Basic-leucine zipper domain-containing protein [Dioscorea alata]|uniref:Basic-leucine zipper domain-containing protein n=1 Tax=Dioscorea alata TaxID=55571 RepID=A0ACB7VEQ4_DIOAL|nr:Basic-leucine zipper domain-containing protein [Dioscorea alata]